MKGVFKALLTLVGLSLCLFVISFTAIGLKRLIFGSPSEVRGNHVEVIELSGVIVSSSAFLKDLEEITQDPKVKAIVLRVNSPGGLVAPSQEIYEAVRRADAKVPVLVSMASLAASGGYYVALGGRKIYANPGTLTGSIGVIMEFVNTEKLYQWAKTERFSIKSGKFKDTGSPFRPMRSDEKELLSGLVSSIYKQFRAVVRERRKIPEAELDNLTDGRIFTGEQAHQSKLVDELLDFEMVLAEAKKLAGLPESAPVAYPAAKGGFLKRLLLDDEVDSLSSLLSREVPGLDPMLASVRPGWQILLLSPVR